MSRPLSILHSLVLCCLLVLTGQALAIARGAPLPMGQVELCTGTGPVMVSIGADGAPISPPHYCPEGVLSLLQAVALPEWSGLAEMVSRARAGKRINWLAPALGVASVRSRGPPVRDGSVV